MHIYPSGIYPAIRSIGSSGSALRASCDLIAPVKSVENCNGGAYFTYNTSIKFWINVVPGKDPVLSGIFFDPINKNISQKSNTKNGHSKLQV